MPTPCQTSTSETEYSASEGSVSHAGPWMPIAASDLLMSPSNGSISTLNVMPTPIVDTSTGKKMVARRYPRPRIEPVSSRARARPRTTFRPEVMKP
ncbi:MAG: hypothetical protein K0S49_2862 [Microbacterium sp.]|nr:hypothetical protein [Microbacterium sp.]